MKGMMLALLSRVKAACLPSAEMISRSSLGQDIGKEALSLFSPGSSSGSAPWFQSGVRALFTSTILHGKVRGNNKKEMSEKKLTRHFVDYRRVKLVAGSGGKGACSFHSEPRKEWGGPDGGNGGDGGSIIVKGVAQHEDMYVMTLKASNSSCSPHLVNVPQIVEFFYNFLKDPSANAQFNLPVGGISDSARHLSCHADRFVKSLAHVIPVYKGEDGQSGGSKNCYGRNGNTTYISVPVGTVVKEQGTTIVDLAEHGREYLAVFGGAGGKGNRFYLSNENRAPMTATPGDAGQERVLQLELRTMAHAGLVGFPNAGKSSLLRAISNARPAVAAYPFTTLNPHVGIVEYRDHEQVAVADIPGLIRGAHLNRGLGISFLRHIERCRFLLFVLDLSAPEPWTQLQHLCYELDQYEPSLSQRPQAIVANKMDLPEARKKLDILKSHVTQRVIPVSALTGQNTEELILHLRELYDGYLQGDGSKEVKPIRW